MKASGIAVVDGGRAYEGGSTWLVGGGRMGDLIRSRDWTPTALGPINSWPQSLRTTVSLCLSSSFPISIAWGPRHVQIYNDGYWPLCGAKHPGTMGEDFTASWASAWPAIGEAFERALGGETSFLEDQRMFLDRNGYLEESFFTFSFSPIRDETGDVGGLFHPVTETTGKMVGQRRTRALRDLASRAGQAQSTADALEIACRTLGEARLDVPFALFYCLDDSGQQAQLSACAGLARGHVLAPDTVALEAPSAATWPLADAALSAEGLLIDDLQRRFGPFSCGPYEESPTSAVALSIKPPGCERPLAILIAAVSSRLPLTESYRAFFDLAAAAVTSAVANARAYEYERTRAQALAEIDRAKTTFFSNVSHEFRTPLTLMLGPLEDELAEQISPLPPARRERLETAHRNSLRLLKLVNALLDFSRIEAGRAEAHFEPTDLATFTGELASVFRSAIEQAGLTLTVDCSVLAEPTWVDRDMWEKIVLNLMSNALKHTFAGGIRVTLGAEGHFVGLTVADTGVGIPEAELPHLFERFRRVKGARSRTHEGTGIGLALVQELARTHGGSVRVESREGSGSAFTVTVKSGTAHLPSGRAATRHARAAMTTQAAAFVQEALQWTSDANALPEPSLFEPAKAGASSLPSSPDVHRARILWADDNADMRDYVTRILSTRYEVVAVANGSAALAAAFADPPDLVLTDVMMPVLDGFGLLRELRAHARTQAIPVIVLSARAGEDSAVEGLNAGADDYLVKPFSAIELMARVKTHLDQAGARRRWAGQLERANKDLEAFTYSVSHDLRAPLRAIDGFSRILVEEHATQLDAEGLRVAGVIRKNTQRMGKLIDDLLAFSRLERQGMSRQTVDMAALARAVAEEMREVLRDGAIEFEIGELPEATGDVALLRQVWHNLLGNAVKYTRGRAPARIRIDGRCEDRELIYRVQDNGVGFDMQYAGKLFGVFQRLHGASEFEGNGVGLALVQRIVHRHGGQVSADAKIGEGATFTFALPR